MKDLSYCTSSMKALGNSLFKKGFVPEACHAYGVGAEGHPALQEYLDMITGDYTSVDPKALEGIGSED